MAFTNEVVLVGVAVWLGIALATYLIGRRSRVWAGAFLAFAVVTLFILNAV